MKQVSWWYAQIATLGPIGYMTAPGTIATLVTVPFAYWLRCQLPNNYLYGLGVLVGLVVAWYVVKKALPHFGSQEDPSAIVLDEVVGTLITFFAISMNVPTMIAGVLLFRFFDISKLVGVGHMERFDGAWGVMLDDILAGVLSNIVLRLLFL